MRLLVYCLYIYLPPRTPLPRAKALRVAQRKAGLEEGMPPQVLPLTCLLPLLLLLLALECVEVCVGASATQLSVRLGGGAHVFRATSSPLSVCVCVCVCVCMHLCVCVSVC